MRKLIVMGKSTTVAVFERVSHTKARVRLPGKDFWVDYITSSRKAFDAEVRAWCESHGATLVLEVRT
jgi:hypothetical protein